MGVVGYQDRPDLQRVAPFGGIKSSGLGREGFQYGIEDYLEIKSSACRSDPDCPTRVIAADGARATCHRLLHPRTFFGGLNLQSIISICCN
ncbi:aldehyde dehydrogenase family protein [Pseudomonas syringae]|uniref:aldehyde dehydrogenase family protein n=1 Tax=Pseudomonas syringae TaxID=317 RepID=UPI003F76DDFA